MYNSSVENCKRKVYNESGINIEEELVCERTSQIFQGSETWEENEVS